MKKVIIGFLTITLHSMTFSQSDESLLLKIGGQLIQDLSNKKEWSAIGKAIETAGDMTYEIEKINALNNRRITIITNPDNTKKVYPANGYKWRNPSINNDYTVERITNHEEELISSSNALLILAHFYMDEGDFNSSLDYCTQSLELLETSAGYLIRAEILYWKKMYAESLMDYGNVLNFNIDENTYCSVLLNRIMLLYSMGKYSEAKVACDHYLKNNNEFHLHQAYNFRGDANNKLGNYQLAMEDYNRALRIKPDFGNAVKGRSISKYELKDYSGAIEDISLAIQLAHNQNLTVWSNRFQLAENYYNRAIYLFNSNSDTQYSEQYKRALEDCNESLKWYNDFSLAYFLRGQTKIMLNFPESGCLDIKKAIEMGYSNTRNIEFWNNKCEAIN